MLYFTIQNHVQDRTGKLSEAAGARWRFYRRISSDILGLSSNRLSMGGSTSGSFRSNLELQDFVAGAVSWWGWRVTLLAPRIGNDVSYVMRINDAIHFAWQGQYLVKLEGDSCCFWSFALCLSYLIFFCESWQCVRMWGQVVMSTQVQCSCLFSRPCYKICRSLLLKTNAGSFAQPTKQDRSWRWRKHKNRDSLPFRSTQSHHLQCRCFLLERWSDVLALRKRLGTAAMNWNEFRLRFVDWQEVEASSSLDCFQNSLWPVLPLMWGPQHRWKSRWWSLLSCSARGLVIVSSDSQRKFDWETSDIPT